MLCVTTATSRLIYTLTCLLEAPSFHLSEAQNSPAPPSDVVMEAGGSRGECSDWSLRAQCVGLELQPTESDSVCVSATCWPESLQPPPPTECVCVCA